MNVYIMAIFMTIVFIAMIFLSKLGLSHHHIASYHAPLMIEDTSQRLNIDLLREIQKH